MEKNPWKLPFKCIPNAGSCCLLAVTDLISTERSSDILSHTHTHTLLHVHTCPAISSRRATRRAVLLPEVQASSRRCPACLSGSEMECVRPLCLAPKPCSPSPESPVRLQLMLKPRPRVWALAGVSWWSFPDRLQSTCEWFVHSKRPTPWLPLSKENLPGRVGNLVQYMCTPGS